MSAKITKRYLDYNGLQYLIEKIKKGIPFILKPTLTKQYDLGQTDKQWKNIYGEKIYQNQKQVIDTIKMNGSTTALTNTNGTVVIPTVAGPQGPTGEQGPVGPAAGFGTPTATTTVLEDNANPTVSVTASGSNTDKVFAFTFGLPKGYQGATGLQGEQGVQGATGGAGFIASVDRQNFTKANWETYGTVGHQENWSNTTIPAGMISGDLFVVTGCATDTGDGYQLVYKYDPTFQPTNTTLRGTCISSHIIARHAQLGTANAGTNISIANNKINAEGYSYNAAKEAFAEGIRNYATGLYSHSEGDGVDSPGRSSHAEGEITHSEGQASHAEGSGTVARGLAAHSEGTGTFADGENSHAEGLKSTAAGENSHAEGYYTLSVGKNSHAEGTGLEKPDSMSFVCTVLTTEQRKTIKNKYGIDVAYCDVADNIEDAYSFQGWIYSDANCTNLIGKISVCTYIEGTSIEGTTGCPDGDYFDLVSGTLTNGTTYYWKRNCGALGENSHSEGFCTLASSINSHAEGINTKASGYASHAEGESTIASKDSSHAEGYYTIASGNYSHAEGLVTIANNKSEHAQGEYNKSTQAPSGATGAAANAYSIFSVGIGTSDTDRRNAIEIHKNGDIFINGTGGVAAGNMNYSKSFQTLFNSLTNDINSLKRFGDTSDTFSQDTLLWKPNVTNIGQEGFYINATTCVGSQVKLVLPDNETYNGANFTNFVDDDMDVFNSRFQYYALYNASDHEITLTLYSNNHSIIIKDNVTSFTLAAGGLIEFCATMKFGSMAFEDVYGENGIYIVTYTQYF